MIARTLIAALLVSTAIAGGSHAAPAEKPADGLVISASFPIYDRLIDPITVAIRAELSTAGTVGTFLDKRDTAGVAEFYAEQGFTPTWIVDGKLTARAQALGARLRNAAADGLPDIYVPEALADGADALTTAAGAAGADVALSMALVTYARHAHTGILDPATLSKNFEYKRDIPDPIAVLADLSTTQTDVAVALAAYNPSNPEFVALRDKLAEIRASAVDRPPVVPEGKNLKLGAKDERVIILRERLAVTDTAEEPALFDEAVDLAVRAFQEQAGLKADGIIGRGTLGALNAAATDHVATIVANMERWRWMPKDLGAFHVRVNIPNFDLDVVKNGASVFNTRVVVGSLTNQTPVFSHAIDHLVVNPTWNVPSSITNKEMLPKARANPASLAGYQVLANIDGKFRAVDPMAIDWHTVDMRRIQIKQPPGERNALGSVKFMFPNQHAVYLHDTPSKAYFQRDFRALSHGCVRVMNPWDFAAALLEHDPNLSAQKIQKMVGGREARLNLTEKVPVHLTYFTAWVDENGTLQVRDDFYGHDSKVGKALGV